MLKFTLVRTKYLQTLITVGPEVICPKPFFVGVSYLPLDFWFFFSCCYKINETPCVLIAVLMCCFVI